MSNKKGQPFKSNIKVSTTKKEYPDMTIEEIKEMVRKMNEQKKGDEK